MHIIRWFSTANDKIRLKKMAQKLQAMRLTLDKTTPRSFAILFIVSTFPAFYFSNKLLQEKYDSQNFLKSSHNAVKYLSFKNLMIYAAIMLLAKSNFMSPLSKYTTKRAHAYLSIPAFIASAVCVYMPPSESKHSVWPVLISDLMVMVVQLQLTNQGVIPFWFYSFRHFIRFWDWTALAVIYGALRNRNKRKLSHPYEFTILQQTQ